MRSLAVVLATLALCAPAAAKPAPPHVRDGTPYAVARRQMVAQGFDPIRVVVSDSEIYGNDCLYQDTCRSFPERANCAGDIPACSFLFRRRSDGSYWFVDTYGEGSIGRMRVNGPIDRAGPEDLRNLVIRLPNGRRVSFEPATPLCSDKIRMNCRAPPPPHRR